MAAAASQRPNEQLILLGTLPLMATPKIPRKKMKTITSVSGGKTSSMMALKYPTDHYVFSVVLINHKPSAPKDKGLLRECQRRIPHFVASAEAELTLKNILLLEEDLGQQIEWVSSEFCFDDFILGQTDLPGYRTAKMLPNFQRRFCTEQLKVLPIFRHCYSLLADDDPFLMNIGYRWDEPKRVEEWNCKNDKIKFADRCEIKSRAYRWQTAEWRIPNFPLYHDRITSEDVRQYWDKKGRAFPEVSNCRFCFHHTDFQQRLQAKREPNNLNWWLEMEKAVGKTFGKRPLQAVLDQPLLDIDFTANQGCFCSD